VAAPAPETNHKWLERTREGGPCVLRQELNYLFFVVEYCIPLSAPHPVNMNVNMCKRDV
jgi:hypothetical protein